MNADNQLALIPPPQNVVIKAMNSIVFMNYVQQKHQEVQNVFSAMKTAFWMGEAPVSPYTSISDILTNMDDVDLNGSLDAISRLQVFCQNERLRRFPNAQAPGAVVLAPIGPEAGRKRQRALSPNSSRYQIENLKHQVAFHLESGLAVHKQLTELRQQMPGIIRESSQAFLEEREQQLWKEATAKVDERWKEVQGKEKKLDEERIQNQKELKELKVKEHQDQQKLKKKDEELEAQTLKLAESEKALKDKDTEFNDIYKALEDQYEAEKLQDQKAMEDREQEVEKMLKKVKEEKKTVSDREEAAVIKESKNKDLEDMVKREKQAVEKRKVEVEKALQEKKKELEDKERKIQKRFEEREGKLEAKEKDLTDLTSQVQTTLNVKNQKIKEAKEKLENLNSHIDAQHGQLKKLKNECQTQEDLKVAAQRAVLDEQMKLGNVQKSKEQADERLQRVTKNLKELMGKWHRWMVQGQAMIRQSDHTVSTPEAATSGIQDLPGDRVHSDVPPDQIPLPLPPRHQD